MHLAKTPAEYIALHSPACTAMWEASANEAPLWRYWGPRLGDDVTPGPALRDTRPEPSFSLHLDQPLSLFPGLGMEWFGQSSLLAHRAGRDWTLAITRCMSPSPWSMRWRGSAWRSPPLSTRIPMF